MTDRKARLAALKAKARRNGADGEMKNNGDGASDPNQRATVVFRNYTPNDASLQTAEADNSSTGEPESKRSKQDNGNDSIMEQALAEARAEASAIPATADVDGDTDMAEVAPRKINADLKRYIQPKLDKLERRTQRAIVELLKERLEQEAANEELD